MTAIMDVQQELENLRASKLALLEALQAIVAKGRSYDGCDLLQMTFVRNPNIPHWNAVKTARTAIEKDHSEVPEVQNIVFKCGSLPDWSWVEEDGSEA